MAVEAARLSVHVDADTSSADSGLSGLASKLGGLAGPAGMAAMGVAAIGGVAAAGLAVGVKSAGDLQQAVANISTIKPEIDNSAVFASLNEMSTRIPQTSAQLGEALYDVFSSMDVTAEQGLKMVETFGKGAIGAGTDAKTFGTAIMGAMNAYKGELSDATHASDVFFNTVNKGVVTGAELAAGMGPALSAAKAMGVDYETAMAMIAGATKEGGPAAQNINNMTNLFNKLGTTDAQKHIKALGVQVVDAAGDFREPVDVLGDLNSKLGDMTEAGAAAAMQKIFPDAQARQGAQVVMSQLDMVRETLAANREATGTTESAYKKMSSTFNSQMKLMQNGGMAILTTLGAALLPSITPLIGGLADALEGAMPAIKGFADEIQYKIGQIIGGFQTGGMAGGAINILTHLFGMEEDAAAEIVGRVEVIAGEIQRKIGEVVAGFQMGGLEGGGINILTHFFGMEEDAAAEAIATISNIATQVSGAFDSLRAIFGGGDEAGGELQLATILSEAFGPEVSANVLGFVQNVKGAFDDLKMNLAGLKSAFDEGGIQGVIASLFGAETAASIQRFADTVNTQILPALSQFGAFLKDQVLPALAGLFQQFADGQPKTDNLAASSLILTTVFDGLTNGIKAVGEAFEILGGLKDLVVIMADMVGAKFSELGGNADLLTIAIGNGFDRIGQKFDELGTFASNLQSVIQTQFSQIDANIQIALAAGARYFLEFQAKVDGVKTQIITALNDLVTGAQTALSNMGQAIRDAINGIAAWVGGLASGMGKNLVQGFIDGIDGLLGSARNKVTELGNLAAQALGLSIEAKSPSRVTYQMGQWFVDGFATGITDRKDVAMKAAEELAKETANAFKTNLEGEMATLRFSIENIKIAYEDQLEPLQRQLELIQSANDLTNERLGLENQVASAQLDAEIRAAKGDPRMRAELQGQMENIRAKQQDINLLQEEERIRKRIAEGKADQSELAELELKRQQIAIQRQLGALVDKDKLAQLTVQKEILKEESATLKIAEAREKLDKQILALPLQQQIRDIKREQEDALDPINDQVRALERELKLHDLQQKGWQGVAREAKAVAEVIRDDVGGALTDVALAALGAGTSAAEAFQNGWEQSMAQFNPQNAFDFMDQRDFDHWQEGKANLPSLPSYSSSDSKVQSDMRTALGPTYTSSQGASPVMLQPIVNIGLDGFHASQTAIVHMEQGRTTDRTRTRIRAAR